MNKLIITLAMLGNVPNKKLNSSVPMTPAEIADTLEECCELGVSIAHLHARDKNGEPTHSKEAYNNILEEIKRRKINVITQLSTGARGGPNTVDSRGQMLDLDCEMASLATGSSNFPGSVNANSPQLVEEMAKKMFENGIKPEIEAFDVAMIDYAKYLKKKGVLKTPLHFNLVMGIPGSIAGTAKNLMFMVDSLPPDSSWTVCGIGKSQVPMLSMAIILGGHIRTGLEDTLLYEKGVQASNRMLVERVIRIAKELGREIATPDEAREIIGMQKRVLT